jgi:hypothetical protein
MERGREGGPVRKTVMWAGLRSRAQRSVKKNPTQNFNNFK